MVFRAARKDDELVVVSLQKPQKPAVLDHPLERTAVRRALAHDVTQTIEVLVVQGRRHRLQGMWIVRGASLGYVEALLTQEIEKRTIVESIDLSQDFRASIGVHDHVVDVGWRSGQSTRDVRTGSVILEPQGVREVVDTTADVERRDLHEREGN